MASTRNSQSDMVSAVAAEDLSAALYMFVTLTAAGTVELADAITDIIYGVLQNAPIAGDIATIKVVGESNIVAGGVLANGAIVGPATTGKAQTAVATQFPSGIVTKPSGADLDLAVIEIIHSGVAVAA